jgi:hypothetical protein
MPRVATALLFALAVLVITAEGLGQDNAAHQATEDRGPWEGLSEQLNAARLGELRFDGVQQRNETFGAASTTIREAGELSAEAAPCDEARMAALEKAMAGAYKPLFFDNNFDYLCDECWCDWWLGDNLKRHCLDDWGVLDIGGQYRARLHNERNMRGLGLTGVDDDFLLHRTRLFGNLEVGDRLRFYAEYLDAESNYENFPPRQIEVDRSDMLNLFVDGKMFAGDSGDLWLRYGRQELLNGNQRLISPLDWANTRRTFEGVKLFWKGENWDVDAFWTNPVVVDPVQFDAPNRSQEFSGL